MQIKGYFKKGIINSLLYDVMFSDQPIHHVEDLLSAVKYPSEVPSFNITEVIVLVEPSFSEYGKSDALLLIDEKEGKTAVFIEAEIIKGLDNWRTSKEYKKFILGQERSKARSKNPFVKLHHKTKLVRELRCMDLGKDCFEFKNPSLKLQRDLRDDSVFLKNLELLKEYCERTVFLTIVPDSSEDIGDFITKVVRQNEIESIPGWDIGPWGFLTWKHIYEHCKTHDLGTTLDNFEFNKNLIF